MDLLLPQLVVDSFRRIAKELKGYARRTFQSEIAHLYVNGNPRKAETVFGWNRESVKHGLFEKRIGHEIGSSSSSKGRPRVEAVKAELLQATKRVGLRQSCVSPSQDRRDRTLERTDRSSTNGEELHAIRLHAGGT